MSSEKELRASSGRVVDIAVHRLLQPERVRALGCSQSVIDAEQDELDRALQPARRSDGTPRVDASLACALPSAIRELSARGRDEAAARLRSTLESLVGSVEAFREMEAHEPAILSRLSDNTAVGTDVHCAATNSHLWLSLHRKRVERGRPIIDEHASRGAQTVSDMAAVARQLTMLRREAELSSEAESVLAGLTSLFEGGGRNGLRTVLTRLEENGSLRAAASESAGAMSSGQCPLGLAVLTAAHWSATKGRHLLTDGEASERERRGLGAITQTLLKDLPEQQLDQHLARQLGSSDRSMVGNELVLVMGLKRAGVGSSELLGHSVQSIAHFLNEQATLDPGYAGVVAHAFMHTANELLGRCKGHSLQQLHAVVDQVRLNVPDLMSCLSSDHALVTGASERSVTDRDTHFPSVSRPSRLRLVKE